jgi:hypothetical protein
MGVADLPRTAGRFQTGQVADFTEIRKKWLCNETA